MITRSTYFTTAGNITATIPVPSANLLAVQMSASLDTLNAAVSWLQVSFSSSSVLNTTAVGDQQSSNLIGFLTLQNLTGASGAPVGQCIFIPMMKPLRINKQIYVHANSGSATMGVGVILYIDY